MKVIFELSAREFLTALDTGSVRALCDSVKSADSDVEPIARAAAKTLPQQLQQTQQPDEPKTETPILTPPKTERKITIPPLKESPVPEEAAPFPETTAPAAETADEEVTIDMVRGELATLTKLGKGKQIKAILATFGASRLPEVPPDKYSDLLRQTRQL